MPRNANRSSQAEHFQMCKWLEKQTFTTETSYVNLAAEYSKIAGRLVTAAGITAGFKTLDIKLPKALPTDSRKLQVVIAAVADLYAQLGVTKNQEFSDLCRQLPKGE